MTSERFFLWPTEEERKQACCERWTQNLLQRRYSILNMKWKPVAGSPCQVDEGKIDEETSISIEGRRGVRGHCPGEEETRLVRSPLLLPCHLPFWNLTGQRVMSWYLSTICCFFRTKSCNTESEGALIKGAHGVHHLLMDWLFSRSERGYLFAALASHQTEEQVEIAKDVVLWSLHYNHWYRFMCVHVCERNSLLDWALSHCASGH